jgi:trk system potassium uptake protein TrkH
MTHAPLPRGWALNASQVVILSFMLFILIGTLVLSWPIAHQGAAHDWVDDFFTAASAVCVTGLATLDPATAYSPFGQAVILFLIQIGGLGYMTLFTLTLVLVGRRISLRDRLNLQQATDLPGLGGLTHFIVNIVRFTLIVEFIGFLLLLIALLPQLGWARSLSLAGFHAVSAFNNAGFSLFTEGLVHWQGQPFLLLVVALLVIIGGLGYPVNQELVRRFGRTQRRPQWVVLVFVVLVSTAILLAGPTVLIWIMERGNPATLGTLPWHLQWVNAFFMAVQPRTAGFHSVPVGELSDPTLLLTMVLMFIGGAPGGTAGGVKLTTMVILVAAVAAAVRGRQDANLLGLKRRVSEALVRKAIAVLFVSGASVLGVAFVLLALEPLPFLPLLFETVSAFGTVGLSTGITSALSPAGKVMIVFTMLIGRVGVMVVMLALFSTRTRSAVRYPEEPLLVG